ncbi:translation initiation factor IF-2 [Heliophilum fasciatum]|uniref:Translation initiation factor IF-2 n=1 Tax=Heliophilum fasciatum TaxID=35700 RepID=A0A4R2RZK9_9FIRM|nr:translation initiation factor IF-2 [Heliophilum fasciatum]MCW2277895.1 translation initiation factor IF-2 [Heliophilum fasciatum]TCP64535.1 translation initiation factor 2 (bIF-2) [Heliophilum fasciatum]
MVKKRIFELARDMNVDSKTLLNKLNDLGINIHNALSTIDDKEIERVRPYFKKNGGNMPTDMPNEKQNEVKAVKENTANEVIQHNSVEKRNEAAGEAGEKGPARPNEVNNQPTRTARPEGGRPPRSQSGPSTRPEGSRPPRAEGQGPRGPRPEGQGFAPRGPRPEGQGPQGPRPEGQGFAPRGPRPEGQGPQGPRPEGQGFAPRGPRPEGQGPRPEGQGSRGPRPEGQGPRGPRPEGQGPRGPRPEGQGPRGPRPEGQGPRGPRPEGQGPRGPRPEGQGPRGPRPEGQGFAPRGPRPEGQGFAPRGPRPEGQGFAPRGPRPEGQGFAPRGPRPEGQGFAPRGPRPEGQGFAPRGPRPEGQGFAPRGPRPEGQGYGPRPAGQGGYPPRPAGARPPMGAGRPGGGRPLNKTAIPKPPEVAEPPKKDGRQRHANHKMQGPKEQSSRYDDKPGAKLIHPRNQGKGKKTIRDFEQELPKHIVIDESVTVLELSQAMGKSVTDIIKKLMTLGVMATINQEIDSDTCSILAADWGITVDVKKAVTAEDILGEEPEEEEAHLIHRPPVVTVMGHVDHGKTSLLDAIRSTNVMASEAGGITQHIGAYQVEIDDKKITFLDTPGHEAFTAMRARGAQVTDVAILVVAADDGVMPQTIEAINHAKAAGVPIVVAINKIDKPGANPDKVKQELTEHGLVVEEWGGDTIAVPVSAKARLNIEQLLDMILLVAEVQDLKANPDREARGTVVEAKLDKGRGPVATVLVQRGTLEVGDLIVAGFSTGKVRAMIDDKGRRVRKAGPSTPVEVLGLSDVPQAGDTFAAVVDEKLIKQVLAERINKRKEEEQKRTSKVSLDDLFKQIKEGQIKDLNVIVKADVQGSVEAVKGAMERLSTDEVRVNCVHGGVGAITETDVMLAAASNALIIGFNVRPDAQTRRAAELQSVDIRTYRVIYDALDDIKAAMSGLLDPEKKEKILGHAEVRQTFKVPKAGVIAGCYVTDGKIVRNAEVRVIRDGIVIHEGKMESLRRFKDDVKEVAESYECGIGIEKFNDLKENDTIEAFIIEEVERHIK